MTPDARNEDVPTSGWRHGRIRTGSARALGLVGIVVAVLVVGALLLSSLGRLGDLIH